MSNSTPKKRTPKKQQLPVNYGGLMPPQASELEEAVLGAVLVEANAIDKIMSDFGPNLFYKESNQLIAEVIIELYREQAAIDVLTVARKLNAKGTLSLVGGAAYIASLTTKIASAGHLEHHLHILQQEALKRSIIQICTSAVRNAFDEGLDVFDTYQDVLMNLDGALKDIVHYAVEKAGDIHEKILQESRDIAISGNKSGVVTGLTRIDNLTSGWQKSDLIILAGRPSMGKTAAAVSMIMYPAIEKKVPVAIFSLEMSKEQLVARMQSNLSEVNVSKIVKKQLTEDEIFVIYKYADALKTAPIYIDDTPNISLLELKGKVRKLVKENGVQFVVIDYLQLMRSGMNIQNREQEIAEISRGLKSLAKELNIPVMALSQLSRGVEARGGDKKPMLQDLRESGQIEQDADMVMFCYRPEYYGVETYEVGGEMFDSRGLFMLLIAKHRNGELGEIPLKFIHEQTKLTNHSFGQPDNSKENRTFVQQNDTSTLSRVGREVNEGGNAGEDAPF